MVEKNKGVRAFLKYIKERIFYLNNFRENKNALLEIQYYKELEKSIFSCGKTHKIYYQYLKGAINSKEATEYMGVSTRTFFRMAKEQEKSLITVIEKKEKELDNKYIFIPLEQKFIGGDNENI